MHGKRPRITPTRFVNTTFVRITGTQAALRTSPLQLAQCAAPADAKVGERFQPRRHRGRDSLLPRRRLTDPELRPYPLHLFRLLSKLS